MTTNYTNTLQVCRVAGIGVEVQNELVGTGDGTTQNYSLNETNVISDSYTISYGSNESDLTALTETTHFTIDKDAGTILLTTAGATLVSTNNIYAKYTYSPKQSDTVLATYLTSAEKEAEKLTGNYWGTEKSTTEYFDGYDSGYPQTDEPFGTQIDEIPEFELKYQGITGITSVKYLDKTGAEESEVDSDYVIYEDTGRVMIKTGDVPNGKKNVEIIYTHGYDSVPALVSELTALIAGIMALTNISGGSYKDISTYTLPEGSISIGQVYVNIKASVDQLKARVDRIVEDLGFRYACA